MHYSEYTNTVEKQASAKEVLTSGESACAR